MKAIGTVHGRFTNFKDMATALGVKAPKAKEEKPRKCPNCGGELRKCGNTNVYVCDFSKLEDKTTSDGTEVQVFSKCGNVVIDKI